MKPDCDKGGNGNPPIGGSHTPTSPSRHSKIQTMIELTKSAIAKGFDGEYLLGELERASEDKPYFANIILKECLRCEAWSCGEVAGRDLIAATKTAFPNSTIGKRINTVCPL